MSELPKFRRPAFAPRKMDNCFCNSGKRFKSCCGSIDPNRPPPYGIQVISNFLSSEHCDELISIAENKPRSRLTVVDLEKSTREKIANIMDSRRVTEKVELEELQAPINTEIQRALKKKIEPYYKKKIAWFEKPSLLRYTAGGLYKSHSDADYYDTEHKVWVNNLDRNISLLIYLNDAFTGGAIRFKNFNYRYQPQKGDLVFFPSDCRYEHEAEKVKSGVRYAVVSWSAISNVPRVLAGRPATSIVLDEAGVIGGGFKTS